MKFLERLAIMFGRTPRAHKPDPLGAHMTIALQANERAGENVRAALEDMLATNDRVRNLLGDASNRARNPL